MKKRRNRSLQQIASKALHASVVLAKTERSGPVKKRIAGGSGFFIAPHLIATNIHCVIGTSGVQVEPVSLPDTSIVSVVAFDDKIDLVILRVLSEGMPLQLADSNTLHQGQRVYAIRCVGGGIEERGARGAISEGNIHGLQNNGTYLRLKATLSQGNSGGPVINTAGKVIGIAVSSDASIEVGEDARIPQFAYAIPVNAVKALLADPGDEELFETWRERPRIHAYAEVSQAYIKRSSGEYKAAIKHYTAALNLNPDLASIYHNRGTLRNVLGEPNKALADWDAALQRMPDLVEAYFNRGAAKIDLGDLEGCIHDCTTAIQLNPDAAPAYYNRAQARMELKQYTEGIEDYTKALNLHLSDADSYGAYYNRALAKYLQGLDKTEQGEEKAAVRLYQSAIPDYTQALRVTSDPVLISRNYNNRGYAKYLIAEYHAAGGRIEKARALYEAALIDSEEAIKRDPKNAYAYCTRAVATAASEGYAEAIADFDRAIKLKPDFAHAYHQRGLAKQEIGHQKEADADFQQAKQLDPNL